LKELKKGDIWLVNLSDAIGHEQKGIRPGIVVKDIRFADMAVIIPTTKKTETETYSHTCTIQPSKENGLSDESVAMVFQIRSISKERLIEKKGRLESENLDAVKALLKDLLALDEIESKESDKQ